MKFPGLPQHKQLTYATKQLIAREVSLLTAKEEGKERGRKGGKEGKKKEREGGRNSRKEGRKEGRN